MKKVYTPWGVELGVKKPPAPQFVVSKDNTCYGWKIDKHGILAFGESKLECVANFCTSYFQETGINF